MGPPLPSFCSATIHIVSSSSTTTSHTTQHGKNLFSIQASPYLFAQVHLTLFHTFNGTLEEH